MVRRQCLATIDPATAPRRLLAPIEQRFDRADLYSRKAAASRTAPLTKAKAWVRGKSDHYLMSRCVAPTVDAVAMTRLHFRRRRT